MCYFTPTYSRQAEALRDARLSKASQLQAAILLNAESPVIPSLSVKGVGSKLCRDSISAGTSNFNVCTYFRSFDVLFYGKLCVFVFVVINLVPGEVWFVIWRRLSGRINNLAALEIKDFKIKAVSSYSHPKLRIFSILLLWESQSFIFIA